MFTHQYSHSQSCDVVGEYFIQSKEDVVGEAFIWNDMFSITIQLNLYDETIGLDKTHIRIKGNTQFEYDEFITTHFGSSQYTYTIPYGKNTIYTIDGSVTLKNGYTYKFVIPETGRTTVMYRIVPPCLIK
jgi:hypothetical protein